MNIFFFINSLSSGGAEHQLVELADGLVEKGYDVTITTYTDVSDHYNFSTKVKRERIAVGKGNKIIKFFAIWNYMLGIKADWVISFGHRAALLSTIPLLFRSRKKVRMIAGERCETKGNLSYMEKVLSRIIYGRADFIVPNSYAQARQIGLYYSHSKERIRVITNYTNLSLYKYNHLPNNIVLRIGIFGRYNKQKNCLRFVEVVRLLKERSNQKFIIEWFGDQKYKESEPNSEYVEMQRKTEEYGLEDVLVLKDHIKDVASAMPKYDAICLPSLYEGFANTICEAICCGKPCLVSDVGDNGLMVKDGVNGFLFDPTDVEDMAKAFMLYFELTPEQRQRMGDISRKRAEELFDREKYIGAYLKLLNS